MQDDENKELDATGSHEDDSAQSLADLRAARKPKRRRRVWIPVAIVVGVLIAAGAGYTLYEANQSDTATDETTAPGDIVDLPQFPSLKMVVEEGTLYVENDGNVTMSDVEVRDAAGTVVCAIGVMSPGDREPCEEAGDAQDLTVSGSGPQGQPVEAGLE